MMKRIEEKMQDAALKKEEMKQLNVKLLDDKQRTTEQKAQIEQKLGQIQPMIDSARAAVSSINRRNIDDIKVLKQPPYAF